MVQISVSGLQNRFSQGLFPEEVEFFHLILLRNNKNVSHSEFDLKMIW